jgi:hypothetical protein
VKKISLPQSVVCLNLKLCHIVEAILDFLSAQETDIIFRQPNQEIFTRLLSNG